MTDYPICGFGLADGALCFDEREPQGERCATHQGLICDGCSKYQSTHECRHGDGMVLCQACVHVAPHLHGPRVDPRDQVDEEMSRAVELILERLNAVEELPSTAPQRRAVAGQIWRGLSNHIAMKVLAGMARPENETP